MTLLQKLAALVTALTEVKTLTGEVKVALVDLSDFLDGV